jgi:hypothetical protein
MERFSDRIGITQPKRQLQLDEMDEGLRNGLWNWACWLFGYRSRSHSGAGDNWHALASRGLWDEFFHRRVDELPRDVQKEVKGWFLGASWHDVYNFTEYLLTACRRVFDSYDDRRRQAETALNEYLEREMAGFRSIGGQLVPVTSPAEIAEIERAATPRAGFEGVSTHINKALELLSKKPEPDKENSIKESISAVEAAAKLLTGETSGGIDPALAILDKQKKLHPAFKLALSKLYAYTSDEDGIRHAILEEADVSFAEARFMLIACSAFANLLIESAGQPL